MKNKTILSVLVGTMLLLGLMVWQAVFLLKNQELKAALDTQQRQSDLLSSAMSLQRIQSHRKELRLNKDLKRKVVDSILDINFKNIQGEMKWGFFNGKGAAIDSLNYDIHKLELSRSIYKVCMSCLTSIEVVKDLDEIGENDSFVLHQTPAQMMDIRGMDPSQLKYLHVAMNEPFFSYRIFILPVLFILGIIGLFYGLIKTNFKQNRLIQQKNEFVNHLSHQFQTPLSSIKLSANLLSDVNFANKSELLKIIQIESRRLENHIKTVLHWVKSDTDRLHVQQRPIDLGVIIERVIQQMHPIFIEHNTSIQFHQPAENVMISADEEHLQLMLYNLIDNAIKHNERAIEIEVSCLAFESHTQLKIFDNGAGVPAKESQLTFKGLGLSYVDSIMKSHSGTMEWSSDASGFTVYLNFPTHE